MEMAVPNVEVFSNTVMKPYSPSSPPPYLNTLVPLTVFDLANYDCQIPTLYGFRAPVPDNQTLIGGLVKVLSHYPDLTGRFVTDEDGHPCILLDDSGFRVIQATVPTTLEEHLPFDPSTNLMNLVPSVFGVELLQVQINRFSCGGVAIGLTSQHRVADGQSISSFLVSWARTVRGEDPAVPYLDRVTMLNPRNPPGCVYEHEGVEFKKRGPEIPIDVPLALSAITNVSVHYSKDFIAKLKAKVNEGSADKRCSTFQSVLTHIWKKVTVARGLDEGAVTKVRTVVNGRARIRPPVPMEYFGNLVLWAFPKMKVRELLHESYGHVARTVHKSVAQVDDGYFRSCIDFGELMKRGEVGGQMVGTMPPVGGSLLPDLEFNSWLGLSFHELDFGGGGPCVFMPPGLPVEGLVILMPSCTVEGAVDVFLALMHEHAAVFRQISHSLD